jgi:hypothetical protein
MMEIRRLSTWQQLENHLTPILGEVELADVTSGYRPTILFRGQGNAEWTLQTTLERRLGDRWPMSLWDYYRKAYSAKHEIGAHTGRIWEITEPQEYFAWLKDYHSANFEFKEYGYLVYLRHFGFPSPLLDWAASPYIATFFAFADPPKEASHVAIYAFADRLKPSKGAALNAPHILTVGPFVDSHKRHFLQQCRYTIAMARDNGKWLYQSHEAVLKQDIEGQDVAWKLIIPVTERVEILKTLDHYYNINAFSLFGSDDALVQTMSNRLFDFAL